MFLTITWSAVTPNVTCGIKKLECFPETRELKYYKDIPEVGMMFLEELTQDGVQGALHDEKLLTIGINVLYQPWRL